jgi:hypothetical protein
MSWQGRVGSYADRTSPRPLRTGQGDRIEKRLLSLAGVPLVMSLYVCFENLGNGLLGKPGGTGLIDYA